MCDFFSAQDIMNGASSPAEEGCTCRTIKVPRTKGCNNLVEIDTYYEDGTFKDRDKVYCNKENLCEECSQNVQIAKEEEAHEQ